jgi:hypothetical protein
MRDVTVNFISVDRTAFHPNALRHAALHLHVAAKGPDDNEFDDWFVYDQGSSEHVYLLESTDRSKPSWDGWQERDSEAPLREVHELLAWDNDHVLIMKVPMPGDKAPRFVFLPGLDRELAEKKRLDIGPGLFVLDRCDG